MVMKAPRAITLAEVVYFIIEERGMTIVSYLRLVLIGSSCALLGCAGSAIAAEPSADAPVILQGATQFNLESTTGRTYRIFLSIPEGDVPEQGRPVIYMTDANQNFPVVATLARRRSRTGAGAVVVGVGYPSDERQIQSQRRTYDLTPRADEAWLKTQPPQMQNQKTGGNDDLLDFMEKEVKPLVEARTKIDRSQQMLFGHSYGGLLVLHALFTRPDTYQFYAASSPSIWFNNRSILNEEEAFAKKYTGKDLPVHLWVTVGELEQPRPRDGMKGSPVLDERRQASNGRELVERLNKASIQGFDATYTDLPGEDHGSAVFPASNRAVRLFFPVQ